MPTRFLKGSELRTVIPDDWDVCRLQYSAIRSLGREGETERRKESKRKGDRKKDLDKHHGQQISACVAGLSEKQWGRGSPFGLHSQTEQQTQQDLCREIKTTCCPSSLKGRSGNSVHSLNKNPLPPLLREAGRVSRTCSAVQQAHQLSPSLAGDLGHTSPQPLRMPDPVERRRQSAMGSARTRLLLAGSEKRKLPIFSFLLVLGSDQRSAFGGGHMH